MMIHPAASIFPEMNEQDFAALRADISKNGQHEPIWICDSKILDGRHRFRACSDLGIQPVFSEYHGNDHVGFVVSLNLMRRHLNESQRAMVAAKLANMPLGGAVYRSANLPTDIPHVSQSAAADMLQVSERSVRTATKVRNEAPPEIIRAVEHGDISVNLASQVIALSEEDQAEIIAAPEMRATALDAVKRNNIALLYTGDEEWYTPEKYIVSARSVMGSINLDPASNDFAQETVRADRYYTVNDDGLSHSWAGNVWMNPPFTARVINRFLEKLTGHYSAGDISSAIVLTNNSTDTSWFHQTMAEASAVCFTAGRISFVKSDGAKSSPTNGQMFFYFGRDVEGFRAEFSKYGLIMVKA